MAGRLNILGMQPMVAKHQGTFKFLSDINTTQEGKPQVNPDAAWLVE